MQMNGAAFVSLNDQVVKLRQEISTQNQYKKKNPDKQGEGRRIELRKKERERPERSRDRPSEREIAD